MSKVYRVKTHRSSKKVLIVVIVTVLVVAVGVIIAFNVVEKTSGSNPITNKPITTKTAKDFNITTIHSTVDFNSNGKDDYTDILLGARRDAEALPTYDQSYFKGGYPPENIGVCTDVVWRAFKNAGYDLKDMVDSDIKKNPKNYTNIKKPDPNIDFRRVKNLRDYFNTHAEKLTTDKEKIAEWQPGDIVIFGGAKHIGIISDKRDLKGIPLVIHNNGQKDKREEDYLPFHDVLAHYRFDASKLQKSELIKWHD